jgi:uncharacterized protein (TIGR02646 family)
MGDLRNAIVAEQGGICCYCMKRIRATETEMKVEHWACQSDNPAKQLDYANLLGACLGGEGKPKKKQHCDTLKANQPLSKNPANPADQIESYISFGVDGKIVASDAAFDKEINEVLNLNLSWMKSNRKAVLDGFLRSIKGRTGMFTAAFLRNMIQRWDGGGGGLREEYCFVVVFYLRKKLKRIAP